jgi:hypothetical protein
VVSERSISASSLLPRRFAPVPCRGAFVKLRRLQALTRPLEILGRPSFFIFSAFSSSPNRDFRVSGRFTNGQSGVQKHFSAQRESRATGVVRRFGCSQPRQNQTESGTVITSRLRIRGEPLSSAKAIGSRMLTSSVPVGAQSVATEGRRDRKSRSGPDSTRHDCWPRAST